MPVSPREPLRQRYRTMVAANADLRSRPWWPEAAGTLELALVEGPDLTEARSLIDVLEGMNSRQQAALLAHHLGALDGGPRLEVEHVCGGGEIIFRVRTAADCEQICNHVGVSPRPDPKDAQVFAVADARGLYIGLVVGVRAEVAQPWGRFFLVSETPGFLPVWEDRDPSWGGAARDPVTRRAELASPIVEWFTALREQGVTVIWEGGETWEVESVEDLITFYDRFRWSPRRYRDGFDERFGIDGTRCTVALELGMVDCLAWVAHDSLVWELDPAVVADALFAAAALCGQSLGELALDGTTAPIRLPTFGDYSDAERQAQVDRFLRRFEQLVVSLDESVSHGRVPDPAGWPKLSE